MDNNAKSQAAAADGNSDGKSMLFDLYSFTFYTEHQSNGSALTEGLFILEMNCLQINDLSMQRYCIELNRPLAAAEQLSFTVEIVN